MRHFPVPVSRSWAFTRPRPIARRSSTTCANVRERVIEYPVLVDADAENWKAWGNHMWPSVYLIDEQGQVRNWWYGELNW
jgi:hypothetical protein